MRIGPAGDAFRRQESAEMREIDLDDVGETAFDNRADVGNGVRALAGRDGNARGGAHARERLVVVRWNRLLDPLRIVRFQHRGNAREPEERQER